MATIELRVDDFEDGVLPWVCASSGEPVTARYGFRATHSSAWPVLLLVAGPVGFVAMVVVMALLHGHVDGWLPLSDRAHEAVPRLPPSGAPTPGRGARRERRRGRAPGVVGLDHVAGRRGPRGSVSIGWCAATVFRPEGSLGLRLSRNGRVVTIVDASEEFAAAYRAQEERRVRRRLGEVSDRLG